MGTPHQTLGVQPDASEDQIKAAYRRLVLMCHPDRCREPEASSWFNEVTTAYRALMTGISRQKAEDRGNPGATEPVPKREKSTGPNDIHLVVRLSPADLRNGGIKGIRFTRFDPCPDCGGRAKGSFCMRCRGNGRVEGKVVVTVRIPAGLRNGSVLRLRGAGHVSEEGRGDVYLRMRC